MQPLIKLIDSCVLAVRAIMRRLARFLNFLSRGRLRPSVITITSLLAHLPIAWLIATGANGFMTAALLIVFGLFDALDGELARLQKRSSSAGMLLDATTDRMKEVILYMGVVALLASDTSITSEAMRYYVAAAVAAVGGSLLVSYVKAKGETAVASQHLSPNQVNLLFRDGLARFEVRIALLIFGLASGYLFPAVLAVVVLSWFTAIERLVKISRKLENA